MTAKKGTPRINQQVLEAFDDWMADTSAPVTPLIHPQQVAEAIAEIKRIESRISAWNTPIGLPWAAMSCLAEARECLEELYVDTKPVLQIGEDL